MNSNRQQSVTIGAALIALGIVWWFNLWWLIGPAALIAGGAFAYIQRRNLGRQNEAFQIALWCVGFGLLLLLGFAWPGILFLLGASLLLRGREYEAETRVREVVARVRQGRATRPIPTQHVPVVTHQTLNVETQDQANTNETRRL
jgi:hypothetical protein